MIDGCVNCIIVLLVIFPEIYQDLRIYEVEIDK